MSWSFSLETLFFHAFPIDLHDALLKEGYQLPNPFLLTTKPLQVTALQTLREKAIFVLKILNKETKRISKLISSHLNSRSHSYYCFNFIYSHISNSKAENIIVKHSNPSHILDSSKPLVVESTLETQLIVMIVNFLMVSLVVLVVDLLLICFTSAKKIGF